MMSQENDTDLFQPTSVDDAAGIVAGFAPPFNSPTQQRLRTRAHLDDTFGSGRRRPEWVWASRDESGTVTGGLAGIGSLQGAAFAVDVISLPADRRQASRLVSWALEQARGHGFDEVAVFAPPDAAANDPSVAPLTAAITGAGWRVFVERCHYEGPPAELAPSDDGHSGELRLEQLTDATDPRLASVHRQVMEGTLDAHDAAAVDRAGFDAACDESLTYLLESDPVDCIRLAHDRSGDVIGLVSFRVMPGGRAFVLFVGVARSYRGRHYAAQLVRLATRELVDAGATVLIADTDTTNTPMVRAFADAGWPRTETRIDFVPETAQSS